MNSIEICQQYLEAHDADDEYEVLALNDGIAEGVLTAEQCLAYFNSFDRGNPDGEGGWISAPKATDWNEVYRAAYGFIRSMEMRDHDR